MHFPCEVFFLSLAESPALFAITACSTNGSHPRNSAPWMLDNSAGRLLNLQGVPLFPKIYHINSL